jgi:replicative DNA helicase
LQYTNVRSEKDFLRHALLSEEKMSEASIRVPSKCFSSSQTREFYKLALSHWDKYGKPITFSEACSEIEKLPTERDHIDTLTAMVKTLYVEIPPQSDFKFLTEELGKLWKARSLVAAIKETGELIEQGKVKEAEDTLRITIDEQQLTGNEAVKEFEITESVDHVLDQIRDMKENPEKYAGIMTGIQALDQHMRGSMRAEFGVIAAKTAGFKSTMLYNFAIESYFQGHDTMLFTIEMPGEQILRRLYSRITGIPVNYLDEANVRESEFQEIQDAVERFRKTKKNKFYIIDVSEGCTPEFLKSKIKEHMRRRKIGFVAIDYLQIMDTLGGEEDLYDWKAQAITSRKLKSIARLFDVVLWTAAQIKSSESDELAFSKAISQNADIILKVSQSEADEGLGQAELRVLKLRRKHKGSPIQINPRPQYGRIHSTNARPPQQNPAPQNNGHQPREAFGRS